jgi:hypothetical protein
LRRKTNMYKVEWQLRDVHAELVLIAASNKINEVWVTPQPILLVTYIAQYAPSKH